MPTRALPVLLTLLAALAALFVIGSRLLARDRDALYDRFAQERRFGLEEAARGVQGDIADIGDDLELASTLLQKAETTELAERELHAIATIKREYLVMYAGLADGPITRVTAFDAPPGVDEIASATLERMIVRARAAAGTLQVSEAFASTGPATWYRVFARRPRDHGPTVAVVVDMTVVLGRLRLSRDTTARFAVIDHAGHAAAVSDATLARRASSGPLAELGAGAAGVITISGSEASELGLPDAAAVALAVPITVEPAAPWTLLSVASTIAIETQEHTVVRRIVVGGAIVLLLLLGASAYVIRNSYRARALRERLRMEQRLLHSEKLVTAGQLAAGIAHEVGTPLNVARGRVELTLSHLGPEHKDSSNQQVAIEQIDRVTRLLQQLLDYVRPAPASIQDVDLRLTLKTVADLLTAEATKRKVALVVDGGAALPTLRTDPDQVQQIVINLVMNAIDASPSGGQVHLRTKASDRGVAVEIVDAGSGIPREIQQQVFDPFFTTKKRGQGTGLGLWVVAQLVRAQSAEIELDSEPGRGTTARVAWQVAS